MEDNEKCPHCGAEEGSWEEVTERVPEEYMEEHYWCKKCDKYYTKEFDITVTFRQYTLE
jgi:DNA-directed RNA polymerase subunit M/transcription elongation factor TFIIS